MTFFPENGDDVFVVVQPFPVTVTVVPVLDLSVIVETAPGVFTDPGSFASIHRVHPGMTFGSKSHIG